MRKLWGLRLFFRLFFPGAIASGVAVWAACGGSDSPAIIPDAGTQPSAEPEPTTFPTSTTPVPTSTAPIDSGPPDSGPADLPPFDGGPVVFLDGGPDFDGGIPCFDGGVLEEEPNDTPGTANLLNLIRCGAVIGSSDGGESDYMKFDVPEAWTGFTLYYNGQVHVIVEVDGGGAPKDISIAGQRLEFVKGSTYYAQLRSYDGGTQVWKLILVPATN